MSDKRFAGRRERDPQRLYVGGFVAPLRESEGVKIQSNPHGDMGSTRFRGTELPKVAKFLVG